MRRLAYPDEQVDDPRFMWRIAGLLMTAGAAIGAISLLLPHPEHFDDAALWATAAVALGAGLLCFAAANRVPAWPINLVLLLGTLAVTRSIHLSGEASGFYSIFYIWIGIYAFQFFPRYLAAGHVVAVAAAYAWVLAELDAGAAGAQWTMVIGSIALGAFVIGQLIHRLRRDLAESASLARERAGMMARFEQAAHTDELTRLPNRRAWNQELARELARARRDGAEFSIGLIDLDHFKAYNDVYGHQAGDRLLVEIAQLWRPELRTSDLLARYGGEEFALALPSCSLEDAQALVDRLRAVCREEQTCSAGVVRWDGVESPDELLRRADQALYAAKAAGRNRVVAG